MAPSNAAATAQNSTPDHPRQDVRLSPHARSATRRSRRRTRAVRASQHPTVARVCRARLVLVRRLVFVVRSADRNLTRSALRRQHCGDHTPERMTQSQLGLFGVESATRPTRSETNTPAEPASGARGEPWAPDSEQYRQGDSGASSSPLSPPISAIVRGVRFEGKRTIVDAAEVTPIHESMPRPACPCGSRDRHLMCCDGPDHARRYRHLCNACGDQYTYVVIHRDPIHP
jgi:hypothetical protein